MSESMTRADRDNLAKLARQRARVSKSMLTERARILAADVEDQLSAEYTFTDAVWAEVNQRAREAVAEANRHIAEASRQLGIPVECAPSLALGWNSRGNNVLASRRTELRRLATARIEEAVASAKVAIDSAQLTVETELIRDGLTSEAAHEFLAAMPRPEDLLPRVELGELGGAPQRSWEPATRAVGDLLSPRTATAREDHRARLAATLGGIEHPALDSAEGAQQ